MLRRLPALTVFVMLVVVPTALAVCTQAGCVVLFDSDQDGVPDGAAGGNGQVVHGMPTLAFHVTQERGIVYLDWIAPDEHADPAFLVLVDVETTRGGPAGSPSRVAADASVSEFSEDGGQGDEFVAARALVYDEDGDGVADALIPSFGSALLP